MINRDDPKWEEIKQLYLQGYGYKRISTKCQVSFNTIRHVLDAENIGRLMGYDPVRFLNGDTKELWHGQDGRCGLCRLPLKAGMRIIPKPGFKLPMFLACQECAELVQRIRWNKAIIYGLLSYLESGMAEPEKPEPTDGRYMRLDGPVVYSFADGRLAVDAGNGDWCFIAPKRVVYPKKST